MKTGSRTQAKMFSIAVAFVVVAAGTLLYQNCTAPIANGIKSVDAQAASLPWAYDAQVDQIAYMSCSELVSGYDTSQYFMFRAGAYGPSAGLSLTSEFLNKTLGGYTGQRTELLDNGTANSGTKVLFAMRNAADFESVYPSSNTVGTDWNPVFTYLGVQTTSEALVTAAASASPNIRFLSTGSLPAARLEGDIEGTLGANPYQQYRTYFNQSQILFGVNFMAQSGSSFARAPADFATTAGGSNAHQSVYGRGLYLKFVRPTVAGLAPTMPDYTLSSAQEYDMQNRSFIGTASSWSCPATMQLRIVRAEDLAVSNVNCALISDAQNADQSTLAIVRRSLRTEDWYVNLAQKCIVPKKVTGAQCYGATPNLHVQYDETAACSAPATSGALDTGTCARNPDGSADTTSASCRYVNATCVHYASICYRP